jgi:putative glutamine amidotransferase
MTPAARGRVLVSAANAAKAVPYLEALAAAGVPEESVRLLTPTGAGTPATQASGVAELAADASGLVLCGGTDVEPRRYGEEPLPDAGVEAVPERDELEWELLAAARARRLPVWGICRGFQVLNVFLGGSLWQDLELRRRATMCATGGGPSRGRVTEVTHDPGPPNDRLAHSVHVLAPQAPLAERLAAAGPAPQVNSRHHQGVKRLGEGLLAVAAAEDGLVEAVVLAAGPGANSAAGVAGGGWWVRGVAWHPENLLALPEQLELWRDFTAAVRAFTANRGPD